MRADPEDYCRARWLPHNTLLDSSTAAPGFPSFSVLYEALKLSLGCRAEFLHPILNRTKEKSFSHFMVTTTEVTFGEKGNLSLTLCWHWRSLAGFFGLRCCAAVSGLEISRLRLAARER
jgi:hypothetical protein